MAAAIKCEELASEELASEKLASEELASEELAGEELASEELASEELASEELASEELASHKCEELAGQFALLDHDKNGEITAAELLHTVTELGVELADDEVRPPSKRLKKGVLSYICAG